MHIIFNKDNIDESMFAEFKRQHLSNWYRFCNGRREGANPSSRVNVLDLESLNHYCIPVNLS